MPQLVNHSYQSLILKINPTEFSMNHDFCTGIANSESEKFSFFIDNSKGMFKQQPNKIIYLKTNDFELENIKKATNPAEINFQKYYYSKNIFRSLKIHSYQIIYARPSSLVDKILLWRWQLIMYFKKLPPTLRFNANALLLGMNEKDIKTKDYLQSFSQLGIIHLFSLSGLHLLILIAVLKKFCSFTRICTMECLEVLLFIILPIYCILVGTKTGICRATILALTKIVYRRLNYKNTSTEIFGASLIIGLFIDPKCLLLLGGQLTYLLSFALIYLWRLSVFKMALMINLLCMPLIILNNYEFNLATIPINVIVAPIFEWFILPITIIFSIFGSYNIQIVNLFDSIIKFFYDCCNQVAQIQVFKIITGKLPLPVVIVLVLLMLIIISNKAKQRNTKSLWCFWGIVGLFIVINKFPLTGQVSLIDVGQGDSILITTPLRRQVFLIDTGGKLIFNGRRNTNFNVDKITIPYLKSQGITHIDAVFMSHQDSDHIGDLGELLKKFSVNQVYFGEGMQNNPKVQKVLKPYSQHMNIASVHAGDILNFSTLKFKVLSPLQPGPGENEDSMVLTTRICKRNWIFTGDLPRDKELEVLHKFHPNIDYLKVGHHGSKTSSDPKFIKKLKPKAAFISVGRKNRYGHPNQETINTLKTNHVQIFKTSEYGMITWKYDFLGNYKIDTFLGK
ncbi:DNA internalization-related competence protein ComEC/Rec2 [Companilactobacillus sp. RD055328]|uniref:DNA internalization-related competence protein ComEC/Rec2 n=1 Tax=Companilactobacillus sp. RD055328 TaxID=2916634 RepID=UPI001FC8AEAA|nr:DNA internalization-related competence protein ComEC/Rec2 [Companilactobacillus sp. RD055328]